MASITPHVKTDAEPGRPTKALRVALKRRAEATDAEVGLFERLEQERPLPTFAIFRALVNAPALLDVFLSMGDALRTQTQLAPRLREMVVLHVCELTGAAYEFEKHEALAVSAGVSRQAISELALGQPPALATPAERVALDIASAVTTKVKVASSSWTVAKSHFDDRAMIELLMLVGWYNLVARIVVPLELVDS